MSETECPTCGREDFKSRHGMKVHHNIAHGESVLDRVEVECVNCGDTVEKTPSQADRDIEHFCDKDCLGEYRSGENHHFWDGGPEIIECEVCGVEIERETWHANRDCRDVCSSECRYKLMRVENPGYIKPDERYYTSDWKDRRETVIERDGAECRACGISRERSKEKYGCDLHVHHVVPARKFETIEAANSVENLVAACMSCHRKYEGWPVFPF